MAVFNFASGKALLFLREMHLKQHSQATFLPKSLIYPFQQVLQGVILPNSPKTLQENLFLPPILPNFGTFGLILPVFYEMK
jgi:hypothetical protein